MEPTIKVLIVDDELYSRDELKHLLSEFPLIKIIGEAESGEAAVLKALQLQPDVVFLDVEMPKMNGMEVAKALMDLKKVPLVVFATAYPQFAVEAFRYQAIDYLVKPYDEEQLKNSIERIEKLFVFPKGQTALKSPSKLAIEEDGEISYIDPNSILYLYKDEKYSKIITKTKEYETKMPLKELEGRLAPYSFFRIHKSYLVNLDYVTRLTPWFNGAYQMQIVGRDELLSVSRNYVKPLRQKLEL